MSEVFYSQGLRFSCAKCSSCCRGEPGYVFLSEKDIDSLSIFHKIEYEEFLAKYCTSVDMGFAVHISLREKANGDCILWDGFCTAYQARPVQCRSYPFWSHILDSRADWEKEGSSCPGIGKGVLHSREEIDEWLSARENNPPVMGKR